MKPEIIIDTNQFDNLINTAFSEHRFSRGVQFVAELARAEITVYPPESEANRPPVPYYIRGRGLMVADGELLQTSEQLGQNYEIERKSWNSFRVHADKVSYAHLVQGDGTQKGFHARRGWKTDRQVSDEIGGSRAERAFLKGYNR